VRGSDLQQLQQATDQLMAALRQVKGVSDVASSLSDADPALNVQLRRDAAANLGVDLARVGNTLSVLLGGSTATTWEAPDGENYSVRLQIPRDERAAELLDVLTVPGKRADTGGSR